MFKRLIPIALLLTVIEPTGAHYITEYWEAKVSDHACFIAVDAGLEFFMDEDAVFGDEIEAIVSFVAPHPGSPNPFANIPDFSPEPMHLNIQLIPSVDARESDITISAVSVDYSIEEVSLSPDPNWSDNTAPVYILDSKGTLPIWLHMAAGGTIKVAVTLSESVHLEVPVQDDQFVLAKAMHDACVAKVRETSE